MFDYGVKRQTLQKHFDEIILPEKQHAPRELNLTVDATFWNNDGVVVFRDQGGQEDLWWEFVDTEQKGTYLKGRSELERMGYIFRSVTGDGLPGLPFVFNGIPFQLCHWHFKHMIIRRTTLNPQTKAGKDLLHHANHLQTYTRAILKQHLVEWYVEHEHLLKEKTVHPSGKSSYTHKNIRSAYGSFKRHLHHLYIYQDYPELNIPRTTSSAEGHFSHVKVRVGAHRGISKERRRQLLSTIFLRGTTKYHPDHWKAL